MFSEHDINLEAVRIALRIQDAHDDYEQAHSMQGQYYYTAVSHAVTHTQPPRSRSSPTHTPHDFYHNRGSNKDKILTL